MESALDEVLDEDAIPSGLAEAARACLRDALDIGDDRRAALHLLAADALMTYACEAALDSGTEALHTLTDAFAPPRLAHLAGAGDRS